MFEIGDDDEITDFLQYRNEYEENINFVIISVS